MSEAVVAEVEAPSPTNPFRRRGGKPKAPARKREPRVPAASQRKNLSDGLALAYGIAGGALEVRGVNRTDETGKTWWEPSLAGRIMKVQAPSAGRELNAWVRDHDWLYAILAPVFGASGVRAAFSVVGPPLVVHLLQVRPEMAPVLEPFAATMLQQVFVEMKKARVKAKEAMEDIAAELGEDAQAEYKMWLSELFSGIGGPPPGEDHREPVAGSNEGDGDHPAGEPFEELVSAEP